MNTWSIELLYERENTLNGITMMDVCHYTFVKTHRM